MGYLSDYRLSFGRSDMTTHDLRPKAIQKLRSAGIAMHPDAKMPEVCARIGDLIGRHIRRTESGQEYLTAWLNPTPQKALPPIRVWCDWDPSKHAKHLRMEEIEQLPHAIPMSGVGNGGNNGMGRGR
jgi:hypothetical protein